MWYIIGALVLAVAAVRLVYSLQSGRCTSEKRLDGKTAVVTGASAGNLIVVCAYIKNKV